MNRKLTQEELAILEEGNGCPYCWETISVPTKSSICGRAVGDDYVCTRPKGHEGPCVACVTYSPYQKSHNFTWVPWPPLLPELPEQTDQPLEL